VIICNARSLAFALLIAALPVGFALAGGGGGRGGAIGAGVGAADMGGAGVGGGAPAGQVGGGPPAGFVGGGLPGSNNPAGNGSAGTGNPSLNAVGGGRGGNGSNTPVIPNAKSNGGDIGGDGSSTGVAAPTSAVTGGASPEALSHQRPSTADPTAPKAIQSIDAEQAPFSPTALARPGPDGVSSVIVAARPCGVVAHETDGTTTCIGIPNRSPSLSRHRRRAAADLP
jgi:hypothetical protein